MDEITMIVVDQVIGQIDQIDDMFGQHASISNQHRRQASR